MATGQRRLWALALGAWLAMLVIAVAIGGAREAFLQPRIGALRAEQVGTIVVCAIFVGLIALFVKCARPRPRVALWIGGAWVAATLVFEFGFFHYIAGVPWADLLSAWDLSSGRLWPLVPVTLGLSPWLLALVTGTSD